MTTIEIGNVYSKLVGAPAHIISALDNALGIYHKNYQFSNSYKKGHWDGRTTFFSITTKKFPTGLMSHVCKTIRALKGDFNFVDKRVNSIEVDCPDSIDLNDGSGHITLYAHQQESVKNALEATRGIVNVATNGGKTEIACGMIKCLLPNLKEGQKIVFFTPSLEIFSQSAKRIEERLGIKVGRIGNGKWDEQVVNVVMIPTLSSYMNKPTRAKTPKDKQIKDLEAYIQEAQAYLRKVPDADPGVKEELKEAITELADRVDKKFKNRMEKHKKTKKLLDSTVMFIADEAHHGSSDSWYKLFMKMENCYFRFGLTGTLDTEDPDEQINIHRIMGSTGKVVSKVSNQYLIENGFSAKPTIYMLENDTPEIASGVDYETVYKLGIVRCQERNEVFVNKIIEKADEGKQCLVIVQFAEHGELLRDILEICDHRVEFTWGDKSDKFRREVLEDFSEGKLPILISTSILDEGVDVSGINCLFLMAGGKSMRKLLQRVGRGLRKKKDGSGLEVYDSLDYHNKYLVDHTMQRYNIYKSEGFTIRRG